MFVAMLYLIIYFFACYWAYNSADTAHIEQIGHGFIPYFLQILSNLDTHIFIMLFVVFGSIWMRGKRQRFGYLLFILVVKGSHIKYYTIQPFLCKKGKRTIIHSLLYKLIDKIDSVYILTEMKICIHHQFFTYQIWYYMQ